MGDETLNVMRNAAREIEQLRERNAVLQATADTVAIFGAALLGRPGGGAMGVDPLWELRRAIAKAEAPAAAVPTDAEA